MERCKASTSDEKLAAMEKKISWLLDSGASYHMTGHSKLLRAKINVAPVPVILPNGEITHATIMGDVWLSSRVGTKEMEHHILITQIDDSSPTNEGPPTRQEVNSSTDRGNLSSEQTQPPEEVHALNPTTGDTSLCMPASQETRPNHSRATTLA
ncbi:unnamed protein product [Cuscuta europaea]|uniref:Retrovirus-related Pol polyprotein from transposon TNT 1-94-like beta-barrel domain-containing protein n=1 Tax=Cuscuta europaea TaxID=41803 RepID=A0A9P0YXV3_CUSEU|nr:unnamed protein product [Cuscuta europaea]